MNCIRTQSLPQSLKFVVELCLLWMCELLPTNFILLQAGIQFLPQAVVNLFSCPPFEWLTMILPTTKSPILVSPTLPVGYCILVYLKQKFREFITSFYFITNFFTGILSAFFKMKYLVESKLISPCLTIFNIIAYQSIIYESLKCNQWNHK